MSRRALLLVIASLTVLVLAAVVSLVTLLLLRAFPLAPDLVGQTREEAVERGAEEGFGVATGSVEIGDEPEGTVVGQEPGAGERGRRGSTLRLSVSAGRPSGSGAVLFEDDFSDPSSGWNGLGGRLARQLSRGSYYDEDGRYRIDATPGDAEWSEDERDSPISMAPLQAVDDAVVEVDAERNGDEDPGKPLAWGVVCRADDIGDNFYTMGIGAEGGAYIAKIKNDKHSGLAKGDAGGAVREGGTNRIRGECEGSRLALSVNGQEVLEAEDSEFAFGRAGLLVDRLDVSFDDFSVSIP